MTPQKKTTDFTDILNAMEDGIYITRQDYEVEFMNKAMIEHFGPGVGKKCYEVINAMGFKKLLKSLLLIT